MSYSLCRENIIHGHLETSKEKEEIHVSQSREGTTLSQDGFDKQGKIIMRWEYPGEAPPKWPAEPASVVTPMAPPPIKLKIKLKGLTG